MNRVAYQRLVGHAHSVRLLARSLDAGDLAAAIAAVEHADDAFGVYEGRRNVMFGDEATLRAVHALAELAAHDLAGEGIAPAPAQQQQLVMSRG